MTVMSLKVGAGMAVQAVEVRSCGRVASGRKGSGGTGDHGKELSPWSGGGGETA